MFPGLSRRATLKDIVCKTAFGRYLRRVTGVTGRFFAHTGLNPPDGISLSRIGHKSAGSYLVELSRQRVMVVVQPWLELTRPLNRSMLG